MNEIRETIAVLKKYAKIAIAAGLFFLLATVVLLILFLVGVLPEYFTIIVTGAGAACFLVVGVLFFHTAKSTTKTLDELEKDYTEHELNEAYESFQQEKKPKKKNKKK
jgi:hypothetical protein